jgi:hypothetical protein
MSMNASGEAVDRPGHWFWRPAGRLGAAIAATVPHSLGAIT